MALDFTEQQKQVIDLRDRNILVSAAAGSGKTAVLVERIIRMICSETAPVDIDRLLIVTFTNAAAAEMRERISLGISRELALCPESEHLQRQAALLHNAQITTIDSFCMFLLKNHFQEIGIDPAFRVMDEGERRLLLAEVMGELLEEQFARKESAFHECVEVFCPGGRERVLEEYILELYELAQSNPWPQEWLEARRKDYGAITVEELAGTDYGRYLTAHVRSMLESCLESYRKLQQLCQEPDGPHMYGSMVDEELEALEKLLTYEQLEEYAQRVPAFAFGRLSSAKDPSVSVEKREQAKELRSQIKDTIKALGDDFFVTPLELSVQQAAACEGPVNVLIDLAEEFSRRVREKKQEKKTVDFSDMEHYALEILLEHKDGCNVPSPVALEYRQYFHEILIDEYQDSNLVQEYLLWAISGETEGHYNRFMVGDVKQSIYKFRLARPELFLEKYDTYTGSESVCQRIDLSKNFRSRREVVETVNGVFSGLMSKQAGGIVYDENAALYYGAQYPENDGCESELLLVEKPAEEEAGLNGKRAEALAIAQRIKELIGTFQVTDKATGTLRRVRYSDMVILLRSNAGWDEEFKKVLEEEGIPVYVATKTGYFAATEVQELLQLLRVLDNPLQDIPLFGTMKSVFGGFTEEEVARIRSQYRDGKLYEAMEAAAAGGAGDLISVSLVKKVQDFLQKITRYRSYTSYLPIRELLQELVRENDYLAYVTALPMGSRRRANVEMLFTKASDFEKTSYHGLFHFIRYIEQLEKYNVDYGEADLQDENADVVRIMSIHKSKGLEFPVTFVAGLSKRFNMQDMNSALIVDADMGIGMDYVDPRRRVRNRTLRRRIIARKKREENLAEELRVLYVALTRPKEKLIMTALLEDAAAKWEKQQACDRLLYHEFVESNSFAELLLPMAERAGIVVHITDPGALRGGQVKEQLSLSERHARLKLASDYADAEALDALKERFAWKYPYQKLQKLYTKTTVSELKIAAMAEKDEAAFHAFEEQEIVPYIPQFKRGEEKVSGTVRGNAYHKVMELLDFEAVYRDVKVQLLEEKDESRHPEEIRKQAGAESRKGAGKEHDAQEWTGLRIQLQQNLREFLAREVASRRLSEEYRKALDEKKLLTFLEDPLAVRMYRAARSGALYREQPFVYGIPADRLGDDYPGEEKVLIQGIIDAFFIENNSLILVDYKTDVVKTEEELWNRYETQLQYYEEALCSLMQLPMREKLLYSFYLGKTVGRK